MMNLLNLKKEKKNKCGYCIQTDNKSSYKTGNGVVARGTTIRDAWWWSLHSLEQAEDLRQALRKENKGKHMKLYLKQVSKIPLGWA